jgi:hypothetical protein
MNILIQIRNKVLANVLRRVTVQLVKLVWLYTGLDAIRGGLETWAEIQEMRKGDGHSQRIKHETARHT